MQVLSRRLSRYEALGLGLVILGIPLSAYSYLVLLNTPFTALGVACVVLGASLIIVPGNPVPVDKVRAMVEGSCVNIEALLEEFDAKERAVYLPPRDGRVFAYVPLSSEPNARSLSKLEEAPLRVVVDVGGFPGLFIFPPGSEVVRLSLLPEDSGLEDALQYVLVDSLEAVGARALWAPSLTESIRIRLYHDKMVRVFERSGVKVVSDLQEAVDASYAKVRVPLIAR